MGDTEEFKIGNPYRIENHLSQELNAITPMFNVGRIDHRSLTRGLVNAVKTDY